MALNDTPANLRFRVGVVKINQRDGDARITLGVAAFDRVVVCRDKKTNRRSFMLGWLDKPITTKSKGAAREMVNLPAFCRDSVLPEIPTKATAEYEPTGLLFAVQSADRRFQELWKARLGFIPLANVQRKHWATIKALNKRVALSIDNGEYGDLRPVAELLARLSESISRFLEEPAAWHGHPTPHSGKRSSIECDVPCPLRYTLSSESDCCLTRCRNGSGGLSFRDDTLPMGGGQLIREIVVGAAPVPTETMGQEVTAFLTQLRAMVFAAIREAGGLLVSDETQTASADQQ